MKMSVLFFFVVLLYSVPVYSTDYFVSSDGSDEAAGTQTSPFRTIQKAADIMKPGETCYIREGIYHEEVFTTGTLLGNKDNPITFTAYKNERVVFDGTEPIIGKWERYKDHIYKTTLKKDIWQLFIDGEIMTSARWPNARWDDGTIWGRDTHWGQGASEDKNGTQYDLPHHDVDLAATGQSFEGVIAILNVGNWKTWTRFVRSHESGANYFTYDTIEDGYKNVWKHHRYFFECDLKLLDGEKEWYYNKTDEALYLWSPGGREPKGDIRGKTQSYAFIFGGARHVRIVGLNFFATTFKFENSSHMTVEDCEFLYPSYSKRMLGETDDPEVTQALQRSLNDISECIIRNCTFYRTDGPGIFMNGRNNTIESCLFREIDYSVVNFRNNGFTIHTLQSPGITFSRNTIHTAGSSEGFRGASSQPGFRNLVEYNHLYNCGRLQSDGGNFQIGANAGAGAVVRYNWTHRSTKYGIRFDGKWEKGRYSTNGLIHHNVCWDTTNLGLRIKGDAHKTYNNLSFDTLEPGINIRGAGGGMKNAVTHNNAAHSISGKKKQPDFPIPGTHSHNWQGDIRSQLRDPDNFDFRPISGSAFIDAGKVIPGVTDGFIGKFPDIGAYEYGDAYYWIPGRKEARASTTIPPDGSESVKEDADLMWLEGYRALSHDVYLGTDRNAVSDATHSSKEFKGNVKTNIFDPEKLEKGKTFHWRIDVVENAGSVVKGNVWKFTVQSEEIERHSKGE